MSDNDSDLVNVLTLVTHERQARDRGWWSSLARCYTPEATIQTSWFDVYDARAIVEVPMTIEMRGTFRGVEVDVTAHLRMLHRAEKRDGGWRFAASVAIFDHDTMTPAIPGATPTLTPDDLEGTRPSYRMLSLWMRERGYTVAVNRHGVDRPAELTALYDDAYAWAALTR